MRVVGLGTMIMGIFFGKAISKIQLAIGILQLATSWIYLGILWSIAWGILIIWKSYRTQGDSNPAAVVMLDPAKNAKIPFEG